MTTFRNRFSLLAAGLCALFLSANASAILVTNGSMTGQPTIGSPPPGWTSISADGDTIPPGGLSGWGTGTAASPDGGTFLALLNNGGGGAFDAVSQTLNGFTVGATYTLQFHFANIGLDSSAAANYANDGLIRASIAGVNLDSALLSHAGFGNQAWFQFSGNFVATAASLQLQFSAVRNGAGGYAGGVDGVSIAAASVPEPAALGLVLLGTAVARRRRR